MRCIWLDGRTLQGKKAIKFPKYTSGRQIYCERLWNKWLRTDNQVANRQSIRQSVINRVRFAEQKRRTKRDLFSVLFSVFSSRLLSVGNVQRDLSDGVPGHHQLRSVRADEGEPLSRVRLRDRLPQRRPRSAGRTLLRPAELPGAAARPDPAAPTTLQARPSRLPRGQLLLHSGCVFFVFSSRGFGSILDRT